MKESSLMRVLFCKIHSPFICFCKPSAAHIYTSGPQHLVRSIAIAGASESDNSSSGRVKEEVGGGLNGNQEALKSCIRKIPSDSDSDDTKEKKKKKKRVTWVDYLGKELAEIKEFESSETWDTDNEGGGSRCLCVIL